MLPCRLLGPSKPRSTGAGHGRGTGAAVGATRFGAGSGRDVVPPADAKRGLRAGRDRRRAKGGDRAGPGTGSGGSRAPSDRGSGSSLAGRRPGVLQRAIWAEGSGRASCPYFMSRWVTGSQPAGAVVPAASVAQRAASHGSVHRWSRPAGRPPRRSGRTVERQSFGIAALGGLGSVPAACRELEQSHAFVAAIDGDRVDLAGATGRASALAVVSESRIVVRRPCSHLPGGRLIHRVAQGGVVEAARSRPTLPTMAGPVCRPMRTRSSPKARHGPGRRTCAASKARAARQACNACSGSGGRVRPRRP